MAERESLWQSPESQMRSTHGIHALQAAVDEYIAAVISEADASAAEGEALLWGPHSVAAKERVERAYERLYAVSARGQQAQAAPRATADEAAQWRDSWTHPDGSPRYV